MKKILSLALVFVMMFAFVSCGKSVEDIEKNLKDAEYKIVVVDNETALKLAAAALEAEADFELEGALVATLEATNGDEFVQAIEFEKSSDAKKYYDALKDSYEEYESEMEEAGEEVEEKFGDICVKAGNTVIQASSKEAMKDAK